MKRKEKEIRANLEKFEEVIKSKKKLPEEVKKKILKKTFTNAVILFIALLYLGCLQIGEMNLQTDYYIIALKVLSVVFTVATIILLEMTYKFNRNDMIVHCVELLIITFFTLFLIVAYSIYYGNFYKIIIAGMIVCAIYYIFKCFIIWIKLKKEHYKSLNDIQAIVAK